MEEEASNYLNSHNIDVDIYPISLETKNYQEEAKILNEKLF